MYIFIEKLMALHHQLSYELEKFITEEEKEKFLRDLSATEEWLYDEGEEQPKKVRLLNTVDLY